MSMLSFALNPAHYLLTSYTVPPLVMGAIAAALGLFVLVRERGSRVGVAFGIFSASVSLWLIALGAACSALAPPLAWWWVRVANVGLTFIPSLVYLFTLTVVERKREFRLYVWASFVVSAIFCAGSVSTNWFIKGLDRQASGYHPQYGPLNVLFLAFLFGMMAASLRLYWVEYRRATTGTQKQRFEGFLLAFCVTYLGSFDYFSTYRAPVYPFGYLPIFVFLVMASRAIKRYRLASLTPAFAASQILETMQGAVLVTDLTGKIHLANRAACQMLGYPESALLAMSLTDLAAFSIPELSPGRLMQQGVVRDHETAWRARDGRLVDVSVSASVLRSGGASTAGIVYAASDVTERKRAEEARRQTQEQLQAANRRLEEMAALKDEFVAKVSHELRTPLTAIREGISLMLDGALGDINAEQRDFLGMVDENIDRLTELISNMLDLSKIEAGRLRLLRRRVPIRKLIETTINSYKAIAGQRAIRAQLDHVADVFADSNRILQVLGNLFSNAVKFTKETGTITFTVRDQDGAVAVSVQDDGVGIVKEDLPRLFQKFSQVGSGGNRPKGTGLGLALCKELVELHKGAISVTSDLGKGSTFTFTLPAYTTPFAMEDGFEDLRESLKHGQGDETVGVIVLEGTPLMQRAEAFVEPPEERVGPSYAAGDALEQIADILRKALHRGDVVLGVEPHWIVFLVVADVHGTQAIIQRLRTVIHERLAVASDSSALVPLRFGTALYPKDGGDVHRLFTRATESLNRGTAALVQATKTV